MGDGTLVHGLELGLYGLTPGETQRLQLLPDQAFGLYDPANVHQMLRAEFGADIELLPDRNYIHRDEDHIYDFTDVTSQLREQQ